MKKIRDREISPNEYFSPSLWGDTWWMKIVINSITSVYHDTHSNELDIDFKFHFMYFQLHEWFGWRSTLERERRARNLLSEIISIDIQMLLDLWIYYWYREKVNITSTKTCEYARLAANSKLLIDDKLCLTWRKSISKLSCL